MLPILFIALAHVSSPWTFRDELSHNGRSMVMFRTVELGDVLPRPPHPDDKAPGGAKFGDLALGSGGIARRAVVWHENTGALWLDADGDGRFASAERHTLGREPLEMRVTFALGDRPATRTVVLKRRGSGLAYAVRGYVAGTVTLGGKAFPALLVDGNADGAFDGAASDRVWVDLDRDGRFDPLTEQFPLGAPLAHGGTAHLLRPDAAGSRVTVRVRPAEAGAARLTVSRLPGSSVVGLTAQLVSEWGELVTVPRPNDPHPLPAGKYRIDSAQLQLKGAAGDVWTYQLTGPRSPVLTVERGKETTFDLTAGIRVTVEVGAARVGQTVRVRPDVVTAAGLSVTSCERATAAGPGAPVRATIRLAGPGSAAADEVQSGFL
jgi:hypothetical protein